MLIKTKGIVLKAIKYGETSLIVDIYTEGKGLRKYIVSGVRKQKAKISAGLLQVMSAVEIIAYEKEGKGLNRLKEIRASHIYQSIPMDIRKGAVGLFIAEIAQKTLKEAESNEPLFGFLSNTFLHLDVEKESVVKLPIFFLIHLSNFLGFMPENTYSVDNLYFDLQNGVFCKENVGHNYFMGESSSALFSAFLQSDFDTYQEINIDAKQRRVLLFKLLDYYRLHIDNFPVINSHLILQEVLG